MSNANSTLDAPATYEAEPIYTGPLADAAELIELAVGFIRDGVAGQEAADLAGMNDTDPVTPLDLMRELGDTDLSDSARLARLLDAVKANLNLGRALVQVTA